MEIVILPAGPIQTNAYLIINKTTNEAVAVDAGPEAFDVISEESKNYGVDLKGLLITHPHWDHIGDIHKFNDAGVPVYAHEEALSWISDAESQRSISMPGLELKNGSVEKVLKHDDSFDMAGIRFEVRFAPRTLPRISSLLSARRRMLFYRRCYLRRICRTYRSARRRHGNPYEIDYQSGIYAS